MNTNGPSHKHLRFILKQVGVGLMYFFKPKFNNRERLGGGTKGLGNLNFAICQRPGHPKKRGSNITSFVFVANTLLAGRGLKDSANWGKTDLPKSFASLIGSPHTLL